QLSVILNRSALSPGFCAFWASLTHSLACRRYSSAEAIGAYPSLAPSLALPAPKCPSTKLVPSAPAGRRATHMAREGGDPSHIRDLKIGEADAVYPCKGEGGEQGGGQPLDA